MKARKKSRKDRRGPSRDALKSLMSFGQGRMEERYRLTVPDSVKRFGGTVLAIRIFRDLTRLDDFVEHITENESRGRIGDRWTARWTTDGPAR